MTFLIFGIITFVTIIWSTDGKTIPRNNSSNSTENDKTSDIPRYGVESDYPDELKSCMDSINTWGMDIFRLENVTNNQTLVAIAYTLMKEKDLFKSLKIHPETALRYFSRVENSYRYTNPYHNNKHAADVAQTINVLMSAERLKNVFTDLEKFAAIFAASTHDVDHPGFTSQYLIETNSEISIKYHDDAVLEHHHLETGFKLLQEPRSDILSSLPNKDKDTFRHIVNRMILSTDNSRHSDVLNKFKALVSNKQSNPLMLNANERIVVLSAMIHLADVSNPTKPIKLYQEWSNRVTSEFFRQGDSERRLGLQVTQNFDRNTTDVHKVQIGFIDFIEPFWVAWSHFVDEGKVYLNQMKENKEYEKRHLTTTPKPKI